MRRILNTGRVREQVCGVGKSLTDDYLVRLFIHFL